MTANHPKDVGGKKANPNYAVLVDTRDRAQAQITYIAQDNIKIGARSRVSL